MGEVIATGPGLVNLHGVLIPNTIEVGATVIFPAFGGQRITVDGRKHEAKVWHEYFKMQYLGYDDLTLPDGKTVIIPLSTTKLNTKQMSDYQSQIEQFGIDHGIEWSF